jgi:hypothetical protein
MTPYPLQLGAPFDQAGLNARLSINRPRAARVAARLQDKEEKNE